MKQDDPESEAPPPTGLDAGLRAAFRPPNTAAAPSVISAIERLTGKELRGVLLEDDRANGESSPLVDASSNETRAVPEGRGNYQLLGEIARGGMGIVLKGRDTDLGRDVALKVLHRDLARRPQILQRFVEEAQIGGQLQHPGIVPVYELGLMADDRPYFTMKLVKGRTFAKLLSEQSQNAASRRRMLDVFSSICQTLAYAHARGVIHRDLKPANVMVGAFGEVQVVDWGLAKILERGGAADEKRAREEASEISVIETVRSGTTDGGSDSVAGSVMGTAAYMAPEQARGEVEKLDERADVFALGSMLCEILTRTPAYASRGREALIAAANARLDDAMQRLTACDPEDEVRELVDLTRECLAPAREARPRSAGEVSRRVQDYLASVEERAHAARVAVAEERVRVAAERRAKRLVAALAVSILAAVMIGGGAWIWNDRERAERGRRTAGDVAAAISDATRAMGQGAWTRAAGAVERAAALAAAGEADADLLERVASLDREVDGALEAEARARTKAQRAAELTSQLDMIRHTETGAWPSEELADDAWRRHRAMHQERAYASFFSSLGVDVGASALREVAATLEPVGIPVQLALALDNWARLCDTIDGNPRRATRRLRVAMALDGDPWRSRVREALLASDTAGLLELIEAADHDDVPPVTAMVLSAALARQGLVDESVNIVLAAHRRARDDYALLARLAEALGQRDGGVEDHQHALRYWTGALALRPDSQAAVYASGNELVLLGEYDEAIRMLLQGVEEDPNNAHMQRVLGEAMRRAGDLRNALVHLERAVELDPDSVENLINLAVALRDAGDPDSARSALNDALAIDPDDAWTLLNLAVLMGEAGDVTGARDQLERVVRLRPELASGHYNLGLAWFELGELEEAKACFRRTVELAPELAMAHNNLALTLGRTGDRAGAIAGYRRALALGPENTVILNNLAVELQADGRGREAQGLYKRLLELDPRNANALHEIGVAHYEEGRFEEAEEFFRRAIESNGDMLAGHGNRGLALVGLGRFEEAFASFDRALAIEPSFVPGLVELAWLWATCADEELRSIDLALETAERATQLQPADLAARRVLGVALYRAGDLDAARTTLEGAEPAGTREAYLLAMACARAGDGDTAREWFESVGEESTEDLSHVREEARSVLAASGE